MRNSLTNRLLSFASREALNVGMADAERRVEDLRPAPVDDLGPLKPFQSVEQAWAYLRSNKERKGHPGRTTIATGNHGERNRRHLVTVETDYGDFVLHATKGWRRAVGGY